MKNNYFRLITLMLLISFSGKAQQDPQYTQYMYNTQVVNPGYVGSREALSFGLLYRTQWVGLDGAPKTATFTVNSPIGSRDNMGLGLSIVHDQLGPTTESNVNVDYSYIIQTSAFSKLAFGVNVGLDLLDVDFMKLNIFDPNDPRFQNNIDNKLQPQLGAGLYYYTDRFYAGLSVPNFLTTEHFDENNLDNTDTDLVAAERLHYFFMAGYVLDINENLKFKPATLIKAVSGAPLQADVSANFLI